jgi:hypothetical protein
MAFDLSAAFDTLAEK